MTFVPLYRTAGIELPEAALADAEPSDTSRGRALVIAPPSMHNTPWLQRFHPVSTAFVSGWMQVRGVRRRRAADRGFVLSDHADWNGLTSAIHATGAETVYLTHGNTTILSRWLQEQGCHAQVMPTEYHGEPEEESEPAPEPCRNPEEPDPTT
jgi:putative mRNA 3-end processing factor